MVNDFQRFAAFWVKSLKRQISTGLYNLLAEHDAGTPWKPQNIVGTTGTWISDYFPSF